MKQPLTRKEFFAIYKKVPRLTVDAVIKSKDGIVLVKRDIEPGKGKWHLPGGSVFYGEKLEAAVKRKAFEETGLRVKVKKFLLVHEIPFRHVRRHDVTLVYLAQPTGGNLRAGKGNRDARFFKKLPRNIGFGHENVLRKIGYK